MVYLLCNQYDKMKILWFTGGTSLYANKNTYNGGGWVASFTGHRTKRIKRYIE